MANGAKRIQAWLIDEEGLSTVEYIIILVLIAVLAVGIRREFGESVQTEVFKSTNAIETMEKTSEYSIEIEEQALA